MAASKTVGKKSKVSGSADDDLASIDLSGGPALVERFRSAAAALPGASVQAFHGSARLMYRNAAVGVASVLGVRDRARRELPLLDLKAVEALPALAIATAWAAEEVARFTDATAGDVAALLKKATRLRALLVCNLDGAVAAGLVPAAPVAKLREGRGGFDTAGDCVVAAGLYKKHAAALKGKTPVTATVAREAAEVGSTLLGLLTPKGGRKKGKAAELKAAIDLRDRLATLLASDHDAVRRAGAWLFGDARAEATPLLLANVGPARKRAPKAVPTA